MLDHIHPEDREQVARELRAAESDDPEASQAGPAAAAIVLAEASLEAFVSEALVVLERSRTITSEVRKRIRGERKYWNECRKFYRELSGQPLDRERLYHERLVPLVKLRHHVLHRAANLRAPGEWPEKLAPYRSEIDHVEGEGLHWTSQLLTARPANWASWAAYLAHEKLHGALPRDTMAEKFYQAITTWALDLEGLDVS